MDGQELPAAPATEDKVSHGDSEPTNPLLRPPKDLDRKAKDVWREYAPIAVRQGTLVEAYVIGFRQFCQQWVYVQEVEKTLNRLGPGTKEAEPYFRNYLKLSQRLESSLQRFKLTAFGKPVAVEKPKPAANPWDRVAHKG